jgi:hypothetical protein
MVTSSERRRTTWTAHEASATGSAAARRSESGLGFAVLPDVDESAHQILVAESRNGLLGLFPRSIFNDTASLRHSIRKKQHVGKEDLAG